MVVLQSIHVFKEKIIYPHGLFGEMSLLASECLTSYQQTFSSVF